MLGLERNGQLLFWSLTFTGFAEGLWRYILPLHIANLGASPKQIGFVLSISGLAMLFGFLPGGYLADRTSRRMLLLLAKGVSIVSMLALAASRAWWQVIPGLALFYFSWFSFPVATSYIAQIYRSRNPTRAFTMIYSGMSVGLVASPALGGWIAGNWGAWRSFGLAALAYLAAMVPFLFLQRQPLDTPPAFETPSPLLKNRPFLFFIIYTLELLTVLSLGQVLAPNYLQERSGLGLEQIGSLGTAAGFGAIFFNLTLGRLQPRSGLVLSQMGMMLAMLLLIYYPASPLVWLAYFLFGLVTTANFIAVGMMADIAGAGSYGLAYGVQSSMMGVSMIAAPAIAGLLYSHAPDWPFFAVIIATPLSLLLTMRLPLQLEKRPGG